MHPSENRMPCDQQNVVGPSADSVLFHRSIAFSVGHPRNGVREWIIFPPDGPINGGSRSQVGAKGGVGSFRLAVQAAHAAIDAWLEDERAEHGVVSHRP
jgi:hypothetical protein